MAVVKWNMREIGRTAALRSNLNPVWEEEGSSSNSFHTVTVRDQQVRDCTLEVEIYDSDTKAALTDFLGCVRYNGPSLVKFLERGAQRQWVDLGKAKRLSDAENRAVKGAVEISGRKWDHVNRFSVKAAPPAELASKAESESDRQSAGSSDREVVAPLSSKEPSQPVLFARGQSTKGGHAYSKPPPPLWERSNTTVAVHSEVETAKRGAELSIGRVERLPARCEVVCCVRLDGVEVGRLHATSGDGNFMDCAADFTDPPMRLTTPPGFSVGGCCLEIEVLRADMKESFGRAYLRGSALKSAVQSRATNRPQWVFLATKDLKTPQCRVQLYASRQPILQERFELNVLGARNIAKADLFGKR